MPVVSRTASYLATGVLILLAIFGAASPRETAGTEPREESAPPLLVRFEPSQGLYAKEGDISCGVPEGRDEVYDPDTGVFHILFDARNITTSAFEITKVAERIPKPIIFRMTGIPSIYGCVGEPLALTVDDTRYALIDVDYDSFHAYDRFDRALFRVEQDEDAVTVEFTEKGRALLKPGAGFAFKVDTGW